jgi:hypothetical protein
MQHSSTCKSWSPSWPRRAHSSEWAQIPFTRWGPFPFGMEVNFRTENVQFEVVEVNLPFNAIIGRPALYRFMAVAHYGYLVLKMPSPVGVLTM